MEILWVAIVAALIALVFAVVATQRLLGEDEGDETMRSIAEQIQIGAAAFLRREYTFIAVFVAVVGVVLLLFRDLDVLDKLDSGTGNLTDLPRFAIAYVVGAIASATAGYIGMYVAVRANVRTTATTRRCAWRSRPARSWA